VEQTGFAFPRPSFPHSSTPKTCFGHSAFLNNQLAALAPCPWEIRGNFQLSWWLLGPTWAHVVKLYFDGPRTTRVKPMGTRRHPLFWYTWLLPPTSFDTLLRDGFHPMANFGKFIWKCWWYILLSQDEDVGFHLVKVHFSSVPQEFGAKVIPCLLWSHSRVLGLEPKCNLAQNLTFT